MVLIPAGYLSTPSEDQVEGWIRRMAEAASRAGVSLPGGVDVFGARGKGGPDLDEVIRRGELGYVGFAAGPAGVRVWRQSSISSGQAELVPAELMPGPDRVVEVAGNKVAALVCGEVLSGRARTAIAATRPDLAVDLGHAGMGQGLIPAMRNLAGQAACPLAHA